MKGQRTKRAAAMKKKRGQRNQHKARQEDVTELKSLLMKTEKRMNDVNESFKDIMQLAKMTLATDKLEKQCREMNAKLEKNPTEPQTFTLETEAGVFVVESVPPKGDNAEIETDSQPGEETGAEERDKDEELLISQLELLIKEAEAVQKGLVARMKKMERMTSIPFPFKRMWDTFFP